MSEKRKSKRRKEEYTGPGGVKEIEKPSKDEYAVAKWLKKNVRTKKTKFLSHNVEYFTSSKAIDLLMKSKFSEGDFCLFPTRENAIEFLDIMLDHKFFHRAKKVPVFLDEIKGKTKKTDKEVVSKKDDKGTDPDSSHVEGNTEELLTKEKRKRKIRLDMHPEQLFVDGPEAYVWIYDPVPIHYWIYGTVLVLGAIVICMFPLWPPILRKGVYYLSIAAAGFLVFIFALTIIRLVVFVIIWLLSRGKLYFWIFPNLTEDVGFLASFWPLYEHEIRDGSRKTKGGKKLKKKKKDKCSDAEDDEETLTSDAIKLEEINKDEPEFEQSSEHFEESANEKKAANTTNEKNSDVKEGGSLSESESEGSRSSTGRDFEMVDHTEVDTS